MTKTGKQNSAPKRPDPSLLGRAACAAYGKYASAPSSGAPRLRTLGRGILNRVLRILRLFCFVIINSGRGFLRFGIVAAFVVTFSNFAFAVVTVQSVADRKEIGLNETFGVSVVISSDESVEIQEPRVPELDGFELLNKQEQTTVSQKLVNTPQGMQFQTQRRKEYNYTLVPKRQGTLSVSSFEVVVDGKIFRTQPVVIKVSQESPQAQRGRPNNTNRPQVGTDPFDDMDNAEDELFNQLLRQREQMMQQFGLGTGGATGRGANPMPGGNGNTGMQDPQYRSLPTNPNDAFFIQVEVDKTAVYEGEQVTVNWYLYTRGQMESLDRLKFPDLKGFWKEIIEEVPTIQFTDEVVNGFPYKKALLASHALFPIKAGTAYIDEYKIKSRVRLPTNGMGGFFGRSYEYTKSSQKVKIDVKPLPTEGRPADFTGAAGQFEVSANVEGNSFPVNQPFSLKLRFEGAGNAKMIDLPAMSLPAGIEVYDTKSESKFFKNGRSFKEFEVLIIPRQEGEITIPALSTSFFDSGAKKYYSKSTQTFKVNIVANPNAPVGSSNRVGTAAAPVIRENALPDVIKTWTPSSQATVASAPSFWAGIYGFILLTLLWKAQRELGFGRKRKSLKDLVQKRMKKVDLALNKQDFRSVGAEMTNIFYLVLGETVGDGKASLEIAKLLEKASPSLRRDYSADIMKYFEVFQTLSFAPDEMLGALKESSSLKENVAQTKKLIGKIISQSTETNDKDA